MFAKRAGFTLLELLAAVTILVILGMMLFQVFGQACDVMNIANARQEVFQYARAALEFLHREIDSAFTGEEGNPTQSGIRGLHVYSTDSMGSGITKRTDSQGIFFSTGIIARDTNPTSAWYGYDVNVARIAYYLPDCATGMSTPDLTRSAVFRSETYDLTQGVPDVGGPFIRNCLFFNIMVMSRFSDEYPVNPKNLPAFKTDNWDSDAVKSGVSISTMGPIFPRTVTGTTTVSLRRALPKALYVRMRMTDERHAALYRWDATNKEWRVPGPDGTTTADHWGEEDPVVQTFSQVINFSQRSD